MHTHVTQNNSEYRDVPVTALTESASNPRKRFDENGLGELAAYVPGHKSCLLCRWPFCGRGGQGRTGAGGAISPRAHNVCSRDLTVHRR